MPRDPALTLRGSVASPAVPEGELVLAGDVALGGAAELVVTGTVSTAVRDALTGASTAHGYVIRLAGEEAPAEDLVGTVELSDEIDSPNATLRFQVRGFEHSLARTLRTWTRVPVEAIGYHGAPGEELPRVEFRGYLVAGSGRQKGVVDPELTLVADTSAVLGEGPLCAEVAPGAGLSRAEIAAALIGGLPVTAPGGPAFDRGLQVSNQSPVSWLREWGEAAGWSWRFLPAAAPDFVALEGYNAELKAAPQAPDETWTADDCEVIDLEPPSRPISKVVVRGAEVVRSTTEDGVEIEIRTLEIRKPYALLTAVEEQRPDGTVVSVSSFSQEAERVVRRRETETHRRNGREIAVITREYGYHNPRAARLRTPSGSEPDGPEDGYYFTRAWIDEEGEYRFRRRERFLLLSERRIRNVYDELTGNLARQEIEDHRWSSRTAGTRRIGAGVPGPWVTEVGVGTDDQSYQVHQSDSGRLRIDVYGLAERHVVTITYDETTGAEAGNAQVSEGYYSPRGAIDVDGHYQRYDGTGQIEIVAPFRVVRQLDRANGLADDGRLLAESQSERAWHVLTKRDGAHDWGGSERSSRASEIYRTIESSVTLFRRQGDGSAERITVSSNAPPKTERIPDSTIPLPRYGDSAWTLQREQPFERVIRDPIAAELWGEVSHVFESNYLTSATEADRLAERIRRRSSARRVRVRRLETLARPGDTVRIVDPHQGLDERALVVERTRRVDLRTGVNLADYTLEVYL